MYFVSFVTNFRLDGWRGARSLRRKERKGARKNICLFVRCRRKENREINDTSFYPTFSSIYFFKSSSWIVIMEETSRSFFVRYRRNNGTWMEKATRLPVNLVSSKIGPQAIFNVSNWKCSLEYFLRYFTKIVKSNKIFLLKENVSEYSIITFIVEFFRSCTANRKRFGRNSASLRKSIRTWNILRYAWLIREIDPWIIVIRSQFR